jgi:hypothetical protein
VNGSLTLMNSGAGATISWSDDPGPFNVYRGLVSSPSPWSYNQTCLVTMTPGPAVDAQLPPVGRAFFYLVTRRDSCGESVPGHASDGTTIANNNACSSFAVARGTGVTGGGISANSP